MLAELALACTATIVALPASDVRLDPCAPAVAAVLAASDGDVEERWDAIGRVLSSNVWDVAKDGGTACRERILTSIRDTLRAERDDRLRCRWMEIIPWAAAPELRDLLRDALRSNSPNVRRRALQLTTLDPHPTLADGVRSAWDDELPEEVLADLFRASAAVGDRSHAADVRSALGSHSIVLVSAALHALRTMPDPEAVPAIVALTEEDTDLASAALSLLGGWSEIPGVDDVLVDLAVTREFSRASQIVSIFSTRRGLRELRKIEASSRDSMVSAQAKGAADAIEGGMEFVTISCGAGVSSLETQHLLSPLSGSIRRSFRTVEPDGGRTSAPCLAAPGIRRREPVVWRISANAVAEPTDVFWWKGETWFALPSVNGACWVPERMFPEAERPDEIGRGASEGVEVDVRLDAAGNKVADALAREGSAVGIEDGVLAVRVDVATYTKLVSGSPDEEDP